MKIAISTDHAGFELLRQLEAYLVSQGHSCVDYGPKEFNPGDDYPDFIFPAARAVASGECEVGIIMGSSGQGEAMAANRIKGVRCGVYYGATSAPSAIDVSGSPARDQYEILRLTREHNHANMLSLAARFLSLEEAQHAVSVWLSTRYSEDERHKRRVAKLDQGQNSANPHADRPKPADAENKASAHTERTKNSDGTAGALKIEH